FIFERLHCSPIHHSFPTRRSSDLKEHWVVLKMKTISGDVQNNMEYTTIDFDEKLDESVFQLDLPDEVAIESLDDLSDGYLEEEIDRKSTRLNSSHVSISYAVFCLK